MYIYLFFVEMHKFWMRLPIFQKQKNSPTNFSANRFTWWSRPLRNGDVSSPIGHGIIPILHDQRHDKNRVPTPQVHSRPTAPWAIELTTLDTWIRWTIWQTSRKFQRWINYPKKIKLWKWYLSLSFLAKKNYFTSSDPHHDMLGGGCQVMVVI